MSYVEGFVAAVPAANKEAYRKHAADAAPLFKEFGVTRMVECWGDDVPDGEVTDFKGAVKAEDGEVVVFSWMEYPDRAARNAAEEKIMSDPRMKEFGVTMPFDGKRMIFSGFEPVVEQGPGGKAGYVDGFVAAVPAANRQAFIDHAAQAAPLFLKTGALRVIECWGEDVAAGDVTDFPRAVKAKDDETVIFSWIEWPDKPTRDAAMSGLETEMEAHMKNNPMPFDGKRLIYGGFAVIVEA